MVLVLFVFLLIIAYLFVENKKGKYYTWQAIEHALAMRSDCEKILTAWLKENDQSSKIFLNNDFLKG
jgi:hypothetical protein